MYEIDESSCTGCGTCVKACPGEAIYIMRGTAVIDRSSCNDCGSCFTVCPQGAIYQEETALTAASHSKPARVTVSPVERIRKTPRLLTVLVSLAPAAMDLAVELVRARSAGRSPSPSSSIEKGYRLSAGKSSHRRRWRGGKM